MSLLAMKIIGPSATEAPGGCASGALETARASARGTGNDERHAGTGKGEGTCI